MSRRKHISWKTKCAAALLELRRVPYGDAKQMTEDQFLSLFHFDHNMLHSSEHEDRDRFWNLTPTFIMAHREKTKIDAKIIAKARRISRKTFITILPRSRDDDWIGNVLDNGFGRQLSKRQRKAIIRSRGFDKTRRKKMDGTVVKR